MNITVNTTDKLNKMNINNLFFQQASYFFKRAWVHVLFKKDYRWSLNCIGQQSWLKRSLSVCTILLGEGQLHETVFIDKLLS